jgi:hypothetical protein
MFDNSDEKSSRQRAKSERTIAKGATNPDMTQLKALTNMMRTRKTAVIMKLDRAFHS